MFSETERCFILRKYAKNLPNPRLWPAEDLEHHHQLLRGWRHSSGAKNDDYGKHHLYQKLDTANDVVLGSTSVHIAAT